MLSKKDSPWGSLTSQYQVDLTEGRYLLAGASDATVAVYDIQRASDYDGCGLIAKHKSLFVKNKQHEHGHKYAISSAIWYPVDTGLFVTGSYDHHINVWDTNTTQVNNFLYGNQFLYVLKFLPFYGSEIKKN